MCIYMCVSVYMCICMCLCVYIYTHICIFFDTEYSMLPCFNNKKKKILFCLGEKPRSNN